MDAIKLQCKTEHVDRALSYIAVLDSHGTALRPTEFAARWQDATGEPALNGQCLEVGREDKRLVIVRSRVGSEGLIFTAQAADGSALSQVHLQRYTYGPLHKTCEGLINTNLLSLVLPISFGDLTADGYRIQAEALQNGETARSWEFLNAGPAAPNLDLAGLRNGRYALQLELVPLFSEGAVPQTFSCDLIVDRKVPKISLATADGGLLTGTSIEVRPSSRIVWQNLDSNAAEVLQYCFINAASSLNECATPSVTSDPLVMPESGLWKLLYRGADAANNLSDWAAIDIAVVDEAKLGAIRDKLDLARFYQKSSQTQFVAMPLLEALESYQSLGSDHERQRVRKDLDAAIFRHQFDPRDAFTFQWDPRDTVEYLGSLNPPGSDPVHAFTRTIDFSTKGLNFVSQGRSVMPEIPVKPDWMLQSCRFKGLVAYAQDGLLKLYDGQSVTTLPVEASRLANVQSFQFSEDCRFLLLLHQIEEYFLIDLDTKAIVPFLPDAFPDLPFGIHMRCRNSFALGEGRETKYYSYCRQNDLKPVNLYCVDASGTTVATPPPAALVAEPQQLMVLDHYLFSIAADKTFSIFDRNLASIAPSTNGKKEELVFDATRRRVLAIEPVWQVPGGEPSRYYDAYAVDRRDGLPTLKGSYAQMYVEGKNPRVGRDLIIGQPMYTTDSYATDLFIARFDVPFYSYFMQPPVDRDVLLFLDGRDQALLRSPGNVFRELSPDASLLRRTLRVSRGQPTLPPMVLGSTTLVFAGPQSTDGSLFQIAFDKDAAFASILATPQGPIIEAQDLDVAWSAHPYGQEVLLLESLRDKTRFHIRDVAAHERIQVADIPRLQAMIPTSDPDLFWFIGRRSDSEPSSEMTLSTVQASTGVVTPISSFQTVVATSSASRKLTSNIKLDAFSNTLFLIYANQVVSIRFRGPLDQPVFTGAESRPLVPTVNALLPTPDFKKWFGLTSANLYVYNEAFELIDTLKASEVLGARENFESAATTAVLDADTIQMSMTRIEISTRKATQALLTRKASTNNLSKVFLDAQGRLQYSTDSDGFVLPLDLAENRAHLCRYLSDLGVRLNPELQERFKQTACGKK